MISSALLGLVGGLLAGGRFKVFVLIPVLLASVVAAAILALVLGLSAGEAARNLVSFAISLQAGYAARVAIGTGKRKAVSGRPLTT